ncbi:hypothetical protein [Clostridium botulinum]|nr:hypothetical protein [Clostridium botulinum]
MGNNVLIDKSIRVDEENIVEILKKFYNVEDIKEQYKKCLS